MVKFEDSLKLYRRSEVVSVLLGNQWTMPQ